MNLRTFILFGAALLGTPVSLASNLNLADFPLPQETCGSKVVFTHFMGQEAAGMANGCFLLRPVLERYREELTGPILEVGPNQNPLLTPGPYPVVYWDKDVDSLTLLRRDVPGSFPLYIDLNDSEEALDSFLSQNRLLIRSLNSGLESGFGTVVISQVLNYVDFRKLFRRLTTIQRPGALVFINNPLGGGIRELRHPNRPRLNDEIRQVLEETGHEIIEYQVTDPQLIPRLLLVARFRGTRDQP